MRFDEIKKIIWNCTDDPDSFRGHVPELKQALEWAHRFMAGGLLDLSRCLERIHRFDPTALSLPSYINFTALYSRARQGNFTVHHDAVSIQTKHETHLPPASYAKWGMGALVSMPNVNFVQALLTALLQQCYNIGVSVAVSERYKFLGSILLEAIIPILGTLDDLLALLPNWYCHTWEDGRGLYASHEQDVALANRCIQLYADCNVSQDSFKRIFEHATEVKTRNFLITSATENLSSISERVDLHNTTIATQTAYFICEMFSRFSQTSENVILSPEMQRIIVECELNIDEMHRLIKKGMSVDWVGYGYLLRMLIDGTPQKNTSDWAAHWDFMVKNAGRFQFPHAHTPRAEDRGFDNALVQRTRLGCHHVFLHATEQTSLIESSKEQCFDLALQSGNSILHDSVYGNQTAYAQQILSEEKLCYPALYQRNEKTVLAESVCRYEFNQSFLFGFSSSMASILFSLSLNKVFPSSVQSTRIQIFIRMAAIELVAALLLMSWSANPENDWKTVLFRSVTSFAASTVFGVVMSFFLPLLLARVADRSARLQALNTRFPLIPKAGAFIGRQVAIPVARTIFSFGWRGEFSGDSTKCWARFFGGALGAASGNMLLPVIMESLAAMGGAVLRVGTRRFGLHHHAD